MAPTGVRHDGAEYQVDAVPVASRDDVDAAKARLRDWWTCIRCGQRIRVGDMSAVCMLPKGHDGQCSPKAPTVAR